MPRVMGYWIMKSARSPRAPQLLQLLLVITAAMVAGAACLSGATSTPGAVPQEPATVTTTIPPTDTPIPTPTDTPTPAPTATFTPTPPDTPTPAPFALGSSLCFAAGTPILTTQGYKPVEQLTPDDRLLSYNHTLPLGINLTSSSFPSNPYHGGALVETSIAAFFFGQVGSLLEVKLADGSVIQVTREHPFYDPEQGRYRSIGDFRIGDRLAQVSADGKMTMLAIGEIREVGGLVTVYNVEVADPNHNYIVAGILAHNKTPTPSPRPPITPTPTPISVRGPEPSAVPVTEAPAHYEDGVALQEEGHLEEAIDAFDDAIRLDPQFALAYHSRGKAYAALFQHERAILDYDEAIRLNPKIASAYDDRGFSYGRLNRYRRAVDDFDEAIRLDPTIASAYNNRGLAYGRLSQYQRAVDDFDEAVRLDPQDATVYLNRGLAYFNLGWYEGGYDRSYDLRLYEEAIDNYNHAIRLEPLLPDAFAGRAMINTLLGNDEEAQRDVEDAVARGFSRKELVFLLEGFKPR